MRTINDLRKLQALPLWLKVSLTKDRIRQWVNEFGEDGCYISFSGGKDSTVLLHLVRQTYPSIVAVFVDTGLEYPEIRDFVKTFDNVEIIKPKMYFKKVVEAYGYPFISKEVSQKIYEYRHSSRQGKHWENLNKQFSGERTYANGKKSMYNFVKWKPLVDAPFQISNKCCKVMKKSPAHDYYKRTGKAPITGQMADESLLRKQLWLKNGCNGFQLEIPTSNPMSFWTEQDVLQYIVENNLPICSVYGKIEYDEEKSNTIRGQMQLNPDGSLSESCGVLRTTGCKRTGCMFCGFGCHEDKQGNGRFMRMKKTHPKLYEWIMKPWDDGGLDYKNVIDYINEHAGTHIEY